MECLEKTLINIILALYVYPLYFIIRSFDVKINRVTY